MRSMLFVLVLVPVIVWLSSGLWLEFFQSERPEALRMPEGQTRAVIFIPGFYGAHLARVSDGQRRFVAPGFAAFGITPLSLKSKELGIRGESEMVPTRLLETVRIIPGVYSQNIYGKAMDHFRASYPDRFVDGFVYDWRYSIEESAERFAQRMGELARAGIQDIRIISHSMGGLVTSRAMGILEEQDPATFKLVKAIAFAGTPFHGTAISFRTIMRGSIVLPSKVPVGPEAQATYPSEFEMSPWGDEDGVYDANLKPMGQEYWDPELWKKGEWALFGDSPRFDGPGRDARIAEGTRILKLAPVVRQKIRKNDLLAKGIRVLNIFSRSQETRSRAVLSPKGDWLFDPEEFVAAFPEQKSDFIFAEGDETVTAKSAQIPSEWTGGSLGRAALTVYETKSLHSLIYQDDDVLKKIVEVL